MKIFRDLIFLILFLLICSFTQDFSPAYPLVDMPGDNIEMDVLSPPNPMGYTGYSSFLSWINISDSVYTIYLSQLDSTIGEYYLIYSDSIIKANTQISYLDNFAGVRIFWQEFTQSNWRIVFRNYYFNDSLSSKTIFADSLGDDPQFVLNSNNFAWIENGNLFIRSLESAQNQSVMIDSGRCFNPDLQENGLELFGINPAVLYEKEISEKKQIFYAEKDIYYSQTTWHVSQITSEGSNINPAFGIYGGYTYQRKNSGVWRVYANPIGPPGHFFEALDSTTNTQSNYTMPCCYSYSYFEVVSKQNDITPYFVVFDSDYFPNNKEIFFKIIDYRYLPLADSVKNISSSEGDDEQPRVALIEYENNSDVAILWNKKINNKTDIWISKTSFYPDWGAVDDEQIASSFHLNQNYPNPFNPSTTIGYYITKPGNVELSIFDVSGRKIRTLYQGFRGRGEYKENFDAKGLASGIYFYRMTQGKTSVTKQMLLIR